MAIFIVQHQDKYFYVSIFINFCIVISATFLFYLFPNQLLSIFSNDKEIITRGASYLFYIGIVMFPQSINVICGNGIRANGNTKWMLFSQIFGSVMVVVLSWILIEIYKLNMSSIYITLFFDELIRGVVNYAYYKKKYSALHFND